MRHSAWTRLGVLTTLAALVIAACSGGFSGGTEPPSAAPATEAPAGSAAPTASAVSGEPVTLTYYVDDNNVTAARLKGLTEAFTALHPNVTFEIETQDVNLTVGIDRPEKAAADIVHQTQRHVTPLLAVWIGAANLQRHPTVGRAVVGGSAAYTVGSWGQSRTDQQQVIDRIVTDLTQV